MNDKQLYQCNNCLEIFYVPISLRLKELIEQKISLACPYCDRRIKVKKLKEKKEE